MLLRKYSIDYALILILAATAFLYIKNIGSYPFWDPWEAKYPQTVREMTERGDYITPFFNGRIRWTKPILIYWAMAVPIAIGENNEFTARLPSAVGAVMGVLLLYLFLMKLHGRSTAIIGACILATTPQYFYMARQAMPDMLFAVFLLAAMGFFALAQFGTEEDKKSIWFFYVSVGLAVLTKGPLGIAIVIGALATFAVIHVNPKRLFSIKTLWTDIKWLIHRYRIGVGIIILFLVAGPWYIAIFVKHGQLFIDEFIMDENIKRFQKPIRGHHGNGYFYIKTILHGMYPWSAFLPLALVFYFYGDNGPTRSVSEKWYFLAWFVAIFLIFAVTGTKQDHYILPIIPAFAIIVALFWEQYLKDNPPFWIYPAMLVSIGFVFLPIRDFIVEGDKYIFDNFTVKAPIKNDDIDTVLLGFLAIWIVALIGAFLFRYRKSVAFLVVLASFTNGIYFCHSILPDHSQRRSMANFVKYYQEHQTPDSKLVYFGKLRYSINYYLGKGEYKYFSGSKAKKLAKHVKNNKNVYIIAEKKLLAQLYRQLRKKTDFKWHRVSRNHRKFELITNVAPS